MRYLDIEDPEVTSIINSFESFAPEVKLGAGLAVRMVSADTSVAIFKAASRLIEDGVERTMDPKEILHAVWTHLKETSLDLRDDTVDYAKRNRMAQT